MRVSVSDAKAQLTELVRRAEAGEEVILTRHGQPAVRLVAALQATSGMERVALARRIMAAVPPSAKAGASAARSQDFLFDDKGMPG
jgi:prevent-host-death family protein